MSIRIPSLCKTKVGPYVKESEFMGETKNSKYPNEPFRIMSSDLPLSCFDS